MNKQPFYHRVDGLLFTATKPIDVLEFVHAFATGLKALGVIASSVEIEPEGYAEPEPGDPSDLLE